MIWVRFDYLISLVLNSARRIQSKYINSTFTSDIQYMQLSFILSKVFIKRIPQPVHSTSLLEQLISPKFDLFEKSKLE